MRRGKHHQHSGASDIPGMSPNSPPAVFIVGIVLVAVVFDITARLVPEPLTYPGALVAALVVLLATRELTRAQVRKENAAVERREQGAHTPDH